MSIPIHYIKNYFKMRSYKLLWNIVCGLLLLSSLPTWSQDLQLAGISFTRFPGAQITDSPLDQEVEVNEYNFFLNLPKRLKNEKTILINGLQYRLVTTFTDNNLNLGLDEQHLHLIGYRVMAFHPLANNWSALVSLNPTLSSTFNTALEWDDFLFNGLLQFVKKKSDRLSYGGGIAFTSRFGEPILIPTLQLTIRSENSKFQVLLPRNITYDRFFGRFTAGLQMAASGSRYNVNYSRTNFLNATEPVDKLVYTRVIIGPSLSYRIGKVIQLEASGGVSVARRVELQGSLFDDDNYDIANSQYFRFGIAIIPPEKETN
ncbi:hypothetical protein FNH22_19225 [Fulvivirga sp. M361]|uniref:DUF6268 family outer membrane beta-barrel protein n=1 Tax=Fulvivirga sp. M361 TaxID=2594266 RepID=UPI00117B7D16|nr:DUF6268 family outer membrane beta-barrel protein [Fulvivirga sp. M361]TRX54887.1 hypothetical protein FNH22_19225 [Fulvivirga sp. M361]